MLKRNAKPTFSSVTFQSFILVFGGSFDHETYIPFTTTQNTFSHPPQPQYNITYHDETTESVHPHLYGLNCHACPVVITHTTLVPRVHTEFGQRFDAVDYEVPRGRLCLLPTGINVRPFAVDRDKVFRAWVSLSGSAGAGFLRGLEATVKVSVWERDAVIGSVHRFLKKLLTCAL